MQTNAALLLFSRTAVAEAEYKQFIPGKNKQLNVRAASLLIRNAQKVAFGCGLSYYHFNQNEQVGNKFGERLANAIERIFGFGHDKVIVIGNDCLQLNNDLINSANTALLKYKVVLAPDAHGGAYLIGVNKSAFDRNNFINCNWQTTRLYEDLQTLFSGVAVYTLPLLNDVNSFADLVGLQKKVSRFNPLATLVQSILASLQQYFYFTSSTSRALYFSTFLLRAPPLY